MVTEVSPQELQRSIEQQTGCSATYRTARPIRELYNGEIIWDGVVHVFDLADHPRTDTCFAWSVPTDDPDRRRFYTVLKIAPIDTPEAAVRAVLVRQYTQ